MTPRKYPYQKDPTQKEILHESRGALQRLTHDTEQRLDHLEKSQKDLKKMVENLLRDGTQAPESENICQNCGCTRYDAAERAEHPNIG